MDTLILQRPQSEKTATSAAGVGIAICLLLLQNLGMFANELNAITGLSPNLSFLSQKVIYNEEVFENNIQEKYKKYSVFSIDKGIKHIKMTKYYNGKPVRINIVEVSNSVNPDLKIEPAIASKRLASRRKIANIANRENAIVAINAGYFKPETGVPLGTLMINNKVYTGPIYNRVAIGISDNEYKMARIELNAMLNTNEGGVKIDNINQPRILSTHTIVYTSDWGENTPQTPKYGIQLVIQNGKLIKITDKATKIPDNGYVVIGPKSILKELYSAKKFNLDVRLSPYWKGINHVISGGPYLVKEGEIFVDMTDEKLNAIGGRNPRTAIGYTNDNNLILLTADGREGASVGLTLNELASLMKELGCIDAMNLDGGGSTVMYINGQIVNKPAMQGGIPLSQTIIIKKDYKISKL